MSTQHESARATRPRSRWRIRRVLAGLLLVLGGVALAYYFYSVHVADERLRHATTEAERGDPGWTWSKLEEGKASIPDKENAMVRVVSAAQSLRQFNPKRPAPANSQSKSPPRFLDEELAEIDPPLQLDERLSQEVHKRVEPAAAILASARALAEMPRGRQALAYAPDMISTLLPHAQSVSELQLWLSLDLYRRAQDGDMEGACVSVQAMFNAARAIGDEPWAVSQLVRMARARAALRGMERILAQGEAKETTLARLQKLIMEEEAFPSMLVSARGERAVFDFMMEKIQTGELGAGPVRATMGHSPRKLRQWGLNSADDLLLSMTGGSVTVNRAALLEYMNDLVAVARLPVEEQGEHIDRLKENRLKLPMLARELCNEVVLNTLAAFQLSRAELRCAAAMLAAERFRLARGRWPESLAELTPDFLARVAIDPYDGSPLRYRRLESGCVVYSVGPCKQDLGGRLIRPPRNVTAKDSANVGFRLWDVNRRRQPAPAVPERLAAQENQPPKGN